MPSKCCRHFNALNKKNYIIWYRSPICSVFEVLLPIALMGLIWWIRTKVEIKQTDLSSLEKYKHPVYPGLRYERNDWKWDPTWTNDYQQAFMEYVGYHPRPPAHPFMDDDYEGTPASNWSKPTDSESSQKWEKDFIFQHSKSNEEPTEVKEE